MSEISALMTKLRNAKRKKETAESKFNLAKHEYEEVKTQMLGLMNREKLDSQRSGKLACSTYVQDTVEVTDWKKYYDWMFKKKAVDALQRRVSQRAILDRIEEGEQVPGIKVGHVRRLRVSVSK